MFTYLYNILCNTNSVDNIIPRLWIGDSSSSLDLEFLRENKIDVIINCTPDLPFFNEFYHFIDDLDIETFRIPVYDSLLEKDILLMEEYFRTVLPFMLRKYFTEKRNILVHCKGGKQRSAIVVAAFLKVSLDRKRISIPDIEIQNNSSNTFNDIYYYILSKRPQAFTYGLRVNFINTFNRFFGLI